MQGAPGLAFETWDTTNLNPPTDAEPYTQPRIMIRILGTIFAGISGLAFGSFLNVCLSRWPQGESIVHPCSHCRHCTHTLTWWENVPLISWLALRGRCRNCRTWIGWRYPLVELLVAVLWAYTAWDLLNELFLDPDCPMIFRYESMISVAGKMIFYWILVALTVLDAENLWLPNWITLIGTALGFLFTMTKLLFIKEFMVLKFYFLAKSVFETNFPLLDEVENQRYFICRITMKWLLGILASYGLILLIRWVYWLFRRREGIGLGDAKLMALLGAWLGLPGALLAFAIGVVLGALAALFLLAVPKTRTQSESWAATRLPLGTFLCIGGIISSLWGQPIIAAYLHWSGF